MDIQIPYLNPLRFYKPDMDVTNSNLQTIISENPQHNNKDIDSYIGDRLIKPYQKGCLYIQPYQNNDTLRIQWKADGVYTWQARIINQDADMIINLTSDVIQLTGTFGGYYYYEINKELLTLKEGIYHVVISTLGASELHTFISDPFHVKLLHENTILIRYNNTYNDQNVIFSQNAIFEYRVHGAIDTYTTESRFETYIDQPYNTDTLSGNAHRNYELQIGWNKYRVSLVTVDKLERILNCDYVKIDSRYYAKNNDSKFNKVAKINDVNAIYKIQLKDKYNSDSQDKKYNTKQFIEIPNTPFYVIEWQVDSVGATTVERGYDNRIEFLNAINADAKYYSLSGYFTINKDGILIYVSEDTIPAYIDIDSTNILKYYIRFDVNTNNGQDIDVIAVGAKCAIDWGDGDSELASTTMSYTHNYNANGIYTMSYYFSNLISFDIASGTTDVKINQLEGCAGTSLQLLDMTGLGITNVKNNLFKDVIQIFIQYGLSGNSLTQHTVNNLCKWFSEMSETTKQFADIDISSNTPIASPNTEIKYNFISLQNYLQFITD